MDKYEFNIKVEKMKKAVDRKDYATAAKVADSINWERSTNAKVLMMIAQIYEKQERYTDARNALTVVYNRVPVGKRVVYKLTELAVKSGDLEDAIDLYREFQEIAPDDPSKLILAYRISVARNDPLEKRISILEAYRRRDFDEKWAYELAALYQQAGKAEECVALCDEIILWFGVGPYVDRAMTLKTAFAPLTPEQEERREHKALYEKKLEEEAARAAQEERASEIPEIRPAHRARSSALKAPVLKVPPLTRNIPGEVPEEEAPPVNVEDLSSVIPPLDSNPGSPIARETALHMTMEQELAQSIQSTSDGLAAEDEANVWVTDKPITVDRVGEDIDGQYTLFRTVAEEKEEADRPNQTKTFSLGKLLTKTRRLDSLRDLAELNALVEKRDSDYAADAVPVPVPTVIASQPVPIPEPAAVTASQAAAARVSEPAASQTAAQISEPAASQIVAAQVSEPAASQTAAAQISEPAAPQVAAAQTSEPAVSQTVAAQTSEPAVSQTAAAQVSEPAAPRAAAAQISEPAAPQVAAAQVSEPAVSQTAAAQVSEPAVSQTAAAQIPEPAAPQAAAAQTSEPAAPQAAAAQTSEPADPQTATPVSESAAAPQTAAPVSEPDVVTELQAEQVPEAVAKPRFSQTVKFDTDEAADPDSTEPVNAQATEESITIAINRSEEEDIHTSPRNMIFCHTLCFREDEPRLTQIKEAFRQAHDVSGIPSATAARVTVEKINRAGLLTALKKLNGRDLLLEQAGQLEQTVIDQIISVIEQPPCTAVILLADTREGIRQLHRKAPALFPLPAAAADSEKTAIAETNAEANAAKEADDVDMGNSAFALNDTPITNGTADEGITDPVASLPAHDSEILHEISEDSGEDGAPSADDLPMTPKEFSDFIHQYALDNDCKFDSMAELALAARLDRMELSGTVLTRKVAINMMDRAIAKAERWSLKSIFFSRYDREGYLILKEKHFSQEIV